MGMGQLLGGKRGKGKIARKVLKCILTNLIARYVLQGSRWRVNDLTYRVTKYPSTDRLSKSEVDEQMKSAFSLWEQVTDLRFSKRDS